MTSLAEPTLVAEVRPTSTTLCVPTATIATAKTDNVVSAETSQDRPATSPKWQGFGLR